MTLQLFLWNGQALLETLFGEGLKADTGHVATVTAQNAEEGDKDETMDATKMKSSEPKMIKRVVARTLSSSSDSSSLSSLSTFSPPHRST